MEAPKLKPISRILLSNDDGIDAIGLKILYDIAVQFSDDVWVIAPSENRSGASRSITLRRDVAIQQIGSKRYSCSGTPADCIIFGVSQILDKPPDLVLTGINHGMNVADDILYSGTVAGAMEAALLKVPAIALSQRYGADGAAGAADYTPSQRYGVAVVRYLLAVGIPDRVVMNVNFPKTDVDQIKGMKPAYLDRHKLGDVIVAGDAPHHYRLGPLHSDPQKSPGSDRAVLDEGWISLTPLLMDVTAKDVLSALTPTELDVEPV